MDGDDSRRHELNFQFHQNNIVAADVNFYLVSLYKLVLKLTSFMIINWYWKSGFAIKTHRSWTRTHLSRVFTNLGPLLLTSIHTAAVSEEGPKVAKFLDR